MQAHILVIDDDERLRELLHRFLEESGFRVTGAANTAEARALMAGTHFALLGIVVMMPGESGVDFLAHLRQTNPVPALFLTAMSETEDRIDGLHAGADDYIAKPFEPRELVLRISRILERSSTTDHSLPGCRFGPFLYDPDTAMLTMEGRRLHLTTAELDLLDCFARQPDQVLSRTQISQVLGARMKGRSIDVAIGRLRNKLEQDPRYPVYLQTVRGKGWLLRTDNPAATQGGG